jgi:hypothetical protein
VHLLHPIPVNFFFHPGAATKTFPSLFFKESLKIHQTEKLSFTPKAIGN